MPSFKINIHHTVTPKGQDQFEVSLFEYVGGSKKYLDSQCILDAQAPMGLAEALAPSERRVQHFRLESVEVACSISLRPGCLLIDDLPISDVVYVIETNYPVVLSQRSPAKIDAAWVAEKFRSKHLPRCTVIASQPAVSVTFIGITLFDVLKLECERSQIKIQGALAVNCLEGLMDTLVTSKNAMVKVQKIMDLKSYRGGIDNYGLWDAEQAYVGLRMVYCHNHASGNFFCKTLEGRASEAGRPILTNKGRLQGGRLKGVFLNIHFVAGSETLFEAGCAISENLIVAGIFAHRDCARYRIDKLVEVQAGGRCFARSLDILGARRVVVLKDGLLGAKFSFSCPTENLETEAGSYFGSPGYTTLEAGLSLVLKGLIPSGYSWVAQAQTLVNGSNLHQQQIDMKISQECQNLGSVVAVHAHLSAEQFINGPKANFISQFGHIQAECILNQSGKMASPAYALLQSLLCYSFDPSLQQLAYLGLKLYDKMKRLSEGSAEAVLIEKLDALVEPFLSAELEAQPLLYHPQFETEILPKLVALSKEKAVQELQPQSVEEQALVPRDPPSAVVRFDRGYQEAAQQADKGLIAGGFSLFLEARRVINQGIIASQFKLSLHATHITQLMGAYLLAYGCASIKSQATLLSVGSILAKGVIDCNVKEWFRQLSSGGLSASSVKILSERVEQGGLIEAEALYLHARTALEQFATGKLSATEALTLLAGGEVVNQGVIESCRNIYLDVERLVNQPSGKISARESLLILCGSVIRHANPLATGQDLRSIAKTLFESLVAQQPLDEAQLDGLTRFAVENAGLLAGKDVSVIEKARVWVMNLKEGVIKAKTLTLGAEKLSNKGLMEVEGQASLQASVVSLEGKLKSEKLQIRAKTLIDIARTGLIEVQDLAEFTADRVQNAGTVRSLKAIFIQARRLFKNTGKIASIDDYAVLCATIIKVIEANEDAPVLATVKKEAQEILAQLQAGVSVPTSRLDPLVQFALNNAAVLSGHYPKLVSPPPGDLAHPLSPETSVLLDYLRKGTLSPKALIQIQAGQIENTGMIAGLGRVALVSETVLKNIETGVISGQVGLALICSNYLENSGQIQSCQDIRIVAKKVLQSVQSGEMLAKEEVRLLLEESLINAGVIRGGKVQVMRQAMEAFLQTLDTKVASESKAMIESKTLREHLVIQNLRSGLIQATDALTVLAQSGENAGHLEAQNARLHFNQHFTQSGSSQVEENLSVEAGETITLLQTGKITVKGALSLLAKQKVFTRGDILAYQALSIVADTLEQAAGKIEGRDVITLTVSDWILNGNIQAQKHLMAKIKNSWDWQREGTFAAARGGKLSLGLDKGYTFRRPIAQEAALELSCTPDAVLHNLTELSAASVDISGGNFRNGDENTFAKITAHAGKHCFNGGYYDNIRGGIQATEGFDLTASCAAGIVNGRGITSSRSEKRSRQVHIGNGHSLKWRRGRPQVVSVPHYATQEYTVEVSFTTSNGSYMITSAPSIVRTPAGSVTNNYGKIALGPSSQFLGRPGQNALVNNAGEVTLGSGAVMQGNLQNVMLYQVSTDAMGLTAGRALSRRPLFTVDGDAHFHGMVFNYGGEISVEGETHVYNGGLVGESLEEFNDYITMNQVAGQRRGGISGVFGSRHHHAETIHHHDVFGVHLGHFNLRGKVFGHGDGNHFSFTSVDMPEGMEARYHFFSSHQPFDTTKLSQTTRSAMGLRAGDVALTGDAGSEVRLFGNQYFNNLWVWAPEGSIHLEEQTSIVYEHARQDKRAFVQKPVSKPNPETGQTVVYKSYYLGAKHVRRVGGMLAHGVGGGPDAKGTIEAEYMEEYALSTESFHNGRRQSSLKPGFSPAVTRGRGEVIRRAGIYAGQGVHYKVVGKVTFEYQRAMMLKLVCAYYALPQEKHKGVFKDTFSGGIAPVILENTLDATLGVVFISTEGETVLENTLFLSGTPVFQVPREKLREVFHYPQPQLYRYKQLNTVGQLGIVAVAAAAAYFTGGLLTGLLAPASTGAAAGAAVGAGSAAAGAGSMAGVAAGAAAAAGAGGMAGAAAGAASVAAGATGITAAGAAGAAAVSATGLAAMQTILIGALQGAVGSGVSAALTKGNIAKNMLQGALLGALGAGLGDKLKNMKAFENVKLIDPEVLRKAAVSVPVAMAASGLNHGDLLKDSLLALGGCLVKSTAAKGLSKMGVFGAGELPPGASELPPNFSDLACQEATTACIAGMTMAVLSGAHSKQIVSIGLQSAGCALANLMGEQLGERLAAIPLQHRLEKEQARLRALESSQAPQEKLATERADAELGDEGFEQPRQVKRLMGERLEDDLEQPRQSRRLAKESEEPARDRSSLTAYNRHRQDAVKISELADERERAANEVQSRMKPARRQQPKKQKALWEKFLEAINPIGVVHADEMFESERTLNDMQVGRRLLEHDVEVEPKGWWAERWEEIVQTAKGLKNCSPEERAYLVKIALKAAFRRNSELVQSEKETVLEAGRAAKRVGKGLVQTAKGLRNCPSEERARLGRMALQAAFRSNAEFWWLEKQNGIQAAYGIGQFALAVGHNVVGNIGIFSQDFLESFTDARNAHAAAYRSNPLSQDWRASVIGFGHIALEVGIGSRVFAFMPPGLARTSTIGAAIGLIEPTETGRLSTHLHNAAWGAVSAAGAELVFGVAGRAVRSGGSPGSGANQQSAGLSLSSLAAGFRNVVNEFAEFGERLAPQLVGGGRRVVVKPNHDLEPLLFRKTASSAGGGKSTVIGGLPRNAGEIRRPWFEVEGVEKPIYKPIPKHEQRGRYRGRGSINPIPSDEIGQKLLESGYKLQGGKQVYNMYEGKFIKFQPDNTGGWHPYEIKPGLLKRAFLEEVPDSIVKRMKKDGLISKPQSGKLTRNSK